MATSADPGFLQELVSIWHAYRVELLVIAGLAVLALRVFGLSPGSTPAIDIRKGQNVPRPQAIAEKDKKTAKTQPSSIPDIIPAPSVAPPAVKLPGPKRVTGVRKTTSPSRHLSPSQQPTIEPIIFYFSLGETTARIAQDLAAKLQSRTSPILRSPQLHNLVDIDFDSFFVSPEKPVAGVQRVYLILLPTYNIDTELNLFIDNLVETHNDFRIDTAPLNSLAGYAVFGFGDREHWPTEQQGFCSQAQEVDKWMAKLTGRKRAYPVGMGDVKADGQVMVNDWMTGVEEVMDGISRNGGLGEGVVGSGDAVESDDEDIDNGIDVGLDATRSSRKARKGPATADLEDIRAPATNEDMEIDFTTTLAPSTAPKEMVPTNSPTYTSLTKQGYTIVGSHSGVKICRWTKSALRGRGSCYKWSFYGIASHQCMETTPSLSCSNKCVFCWRHGTNPVSTTWRWTVDAPELIFEGVKAGHYKKIKSMRGVPGVRAERFSEAMRIRHCALSLVGEPIFYPHINQLLAMLHGERISTFLVCNAQHPDQLAALDHVTQLYVSIDASNKEALKKIDRPLHRDFWERFLRCMDILREKRNVQRTVFRLTLVKGFNIDEEAEGYADLVERARPGLVEVKGVTYCGTSTSVAAGLTMQNVPFYEEVCAFVEALNKALARRGLGYGVAAEHAHSCCILLAEKERFLKDDGWHTLIDYQRFFECLESGKDFGPQDYVGAKTPEWAIYGNGGFDPRDDRVDRKGRPKEPVVPGRPIASI